MSVVPACNHPRRPAATGCASLVTLALVALAAGCAPRADPAEGWDATGGRASVTPAHGGRHDVPLPGLPSTRQARVQLATLVVAVPRSLDGYRRKAFPHWSPRDGHCDTRELVLARDAVRGRRDGRCRTVAGTWYSPYDGRTLRRETQVDVDHVVPLAEAWRSGAAGWSEARREAFANDLRRPQLLTVSTAVNHAKRDRPPHRWLPPAAGFRCVYVRAWVAVKAHYRLTVTREERRALAATLASCPRS